MTWFYITVGVLGTLGIGIAIYEWRRGKPFAIQHIDDDKETSHANRELTRISDEIATRTYTGPMH